MNSPSDLPRPDYSEGSININSKTVSEHEFQVTDPTTYEISNGDTITRGIGEALAPASKFGNDSNMNIYGEFGTGMLLRGSSSHTFKSVHFRTKLGLH